MNEVVYDAAVLIAADRNDRRIWADHRARLELGMMPLVPAGVVAQVSRSPRQAQLRRLLRGCDVVVLDESGAHESGRLLRKAGTDDIVDASVVAAALNRGAYILTGDADDIERLCSAAGARVVIVSV